LAGGKDSTGDVISVKESRQAMSDLGGVGLGMSLSDAGDGQLARGLGESQRRGEPLVSSARAQQFKIASSLRRAGIDKSAGSRAIVSMT